MDSLKDYKSIKKIALVDLGYSHKQNGDLVPPEVGFIFCQASEWKIFECGNYVVGRGGNIVKTETFGAITMRQLRDLINSSEHLALCEGFQDVFKTELIFTCKSLTG